jgi:hypothetical protein
MWFLRTESGAVAIEKRNEEEFLAKAEATTTFKIVLRFIRIGIQQQIFDGNGFHSDVGVCLTLCSSTVPVPGKVFAYLEQAVFANLQHNQLPVTHYLYRYVSVGRMKIATSLELKLELRAVPVAGIPVPDK